MSLILKKLIVISSLTVTSIALTGYTDYYGGGNGSSGNGSPGPASPQSNNGDSSSDGASRGCSISRCMNPNPYTHINNRITRQDYDDFSRVQRYRYGEGDPTVTDTFEPDSIKPRGASVFHGF